MYSRIGEVLKSDGMTVGMAVGMAVGMHGG